MIKKLILIIILLLCVNSSYAKDKPTYGIVFFTSNSCPACQQMKRDVWPHKTIKEKMLKFGWHEINYEDDAELVTKYKVKLLPTIFLIKYDIKNRKECDILKKEVGYMSVRQTEKFLKIPDKKTP
jgi:thioredoxin-related protein